MRHIELFSGIGGFALAAQEVWGEDYEPVLFCDNDPFCQADIKKRFPGVKVWGDIRRLIAHAKKRGLEEYGQRQEDKQPSKQIEGNGKIQLIRNAKSQRHTENGEVRQGKGPNPLRSNTNDEQGLIANTKGAGQLREEEQEDHGEDSEGRRGYDPTDKDSNPVANASQYRLDAKHSQSEKPICEGELNTQENKRGRLRSESYPTDSVIANARSEKPNGLSGIKGKEVSTFRGSIDLLTGGFPCQPFSQAGKRRGKADNRFLWPEMLECIRLFRPVWVIAENVHGILSIEGGLVFNQVCLDLEAEGYEVWPFIIPACAINAPHRRDRVWVVAHSRNTGNRPFRENGSRNERCQRFRTEEDVSSREKISLTEDAEENHSNASNAESERNRGSSGNGCGMRERKVVQEEQKGGEVGREGEGCAGKLYDPDTQDKGLERGNPEGNGCPEGWASERPEFAPDTQGRNSRKQAEQEGRQDIGGGDSYAPDTKIERGKQPRSSRTGGTGLQNDCWNQDWLEVAARLCGVDDGLPARVDGLELSKARHRVERLKALGNAIVPQVAVEIMKAIKAVDGC